MISEFFIDSGFSIAEKVLEKIPEINWDTNTGAWEYLKDFLDMVCYLLPLDTITAIITLLIAISSLRIVISLAGFIKRTVPFV